MIVIILKRCEILRKQTITREASVLHTIHILSWFFALHWMPEGAELDITGFFAEDCENQPQKVEITATSNMDAATFEIKQTSLTMRRMKSHFFSKQVDKKNACTHLCRSKLSAWRLHSQAEQWWSSGTFLWDPSHTQCTVICYWQLPAQTHNWPGMKTL